MIHRSDRCSTAAVIDAVRLRFGVLRSWPSVVRVGVWVLVWCLALSLIIAPQLPRYTDRDHQADVPASGVRYVGPISRTDYSGFLPPPHDPDAFTLAWIGGSEVKLREVSVAGAFDRRVDTVGGRPLVIDGYNVIAPRVIDALRAVDTASRSGADAIVVALNPAWVRAEWSLRGWPNLDVSDIGTLWARPSTFTWALALTGPSDYGWRLSRAALALVDAQTRLNERARDKVEWLDVLDDPSAELEASAETGDPRLPPGSDMWLVDRYGPDALGDEDRRVAALIGGIGISQHEAQFFAELLLDAAGDAGVPVFLYVTPFAPESLADPAFDAAAHEVEAFWTALAVTIDSPLVELEPRSLSRDHPESAGTFANNVHMVDPSWFADALVDRLCSQWSAADAAGECR
jgi:hypothetical protein